MWGWCCHGNSISLNVCVFAELTPPNFSMPPSSSSSSSFISLSLGDGDITEGRGFLQRARGGGRETQTHRERERCAVKHEEGRARRERAEE